MSRADDSVPRPRPSRALAGAFSGLTLALAVLGLSARAQEGPPPNVPKVDKPVEPGIWITEVDRDEAGKVQILLNVGKDTGLERGDSLDIEREGKTIAHASVVASYSDVSVAVVNEITEKNVVIARGDWVRAKGPKHSPRLPSSVTNSITEVKEGRATVDGGRNMGLHAGDEATVVRDGKPVGRIKLEIVNDTASGGPIVEGDLKVGDHVEFVPAEHAHGNGTPESDLNREEIRRLEKEAETPRGIDFVATGFLGVVGEIEHAGPILAPCHVGVLVRRVIDNSPADRAKIRAGDRVIGIDDRVVRTPSEIYRGVKRRAGDFVKVTIIRDDVIQTVSADFRKRY